MLDYDLILPIGERCHTKVALLELFPNMPINLFDTFGNLSLDSVYDIMKNHFDNFLLKEDLRFINKGDNIHYFVLEQKYNIRCPHIFKCDMNEQESLDKYYPLLTRMIRDTKNRIARANTILMVHATFDYTYTLQNFLDFSQQCRKLFPEKKIDFLFLQYSDNQSLVNTYTNDGVYIYNIPNHRERNNSLDNFFIWSNMNVLKLSIIKHFYLTLYKEFNRFKEENTILS